MQKENYIILFKNNWINRFLRSKPMSRQLHDSNKIILVGIRRKKPLHFVLLLGMYVQSVGMVCQLV